MAKYLMVSDPKWVDAGHTRVDMLVYFPERGGWLPFTASASDPSPHGRDLYQRAAAGDFGPVAPHVVPVAGPPPVPARVTPLQARKALRAAGLKSQVDAYVATLSDEAKEEWEYCVTVDRSNGLVVEAATALGMTSGQIDDLFRTAAGL